MRFKNIMKLGVYTIEKTLYEGDITELIAKTTSGEIAVLENHVPLITRLIEAPLRIKEKAGTEKVIHIEGGYLEIQPENSIVVLVDTQ
jgi:F-type H+-transporting ATPase subunit epsilon